MASEIPLVITGDAKGAERAYSQVIRANQRLESRLKALQDQSRQLRSENRRLSRDQVAGIRSVGRASRRLSSDQRSNATSQLDGVRRLVAGYVSLRAAIGAVRTVGGAVLSDFVASNQQLTQQVDQFADTLADAEIKLQIQGQLNEDEVREQIRRIAQERVNLPTASLVESVNLQRQLFSSGFQAEDVVSGELQRVFLELRAATNQFGRGAEVPEAAIRALAAELAARGDDVNARNTRLLAQQVTELFSGTNIQLPDVGFLARNSAGLQAAGIGREESLSAFAALIDLTGSAEIAATQLTQITSALANAATRSETLERDFGLDSSQFDLVGEGTRPLLTSIAALTEGLSRLDDEQRQLALLEIFPKRAQFAFQTLADNTQRVEDNFSNLTNGLTAFDGAVSAFSESTVAARARLDAFLQDLSLIHI